MPRPFMPPKKGELAGREKDEMGETTRSVSVIPSAVEFFGSIFRDLQPVKTGGAPLAREAAEGGLDVLFEMTSDL